jgi:branched-chain amino acid aminotransferase
MALIHLNGRLVEAAAARIDPADRGFLLADGLFETLRVYDGRAFRLDRHLARLAAGADLLGLPMPAAARIAAAVGETLAANRHRQASLRITLARGVGPRGLLPPADASPTLLIASHPLAEAGPTSFAAGLVGVRRNEHSPLSQLKSLAYLDNILALREAAAAGCDEALLLNTAGRPVAGSRSNLFLVREGTLLTPPASEGVLPGIARETILELAQAAGIPCRQMPLTLADLAAADEAFVSNSVIELKPLRLLAGRALETGPMALDLGRRYAEAASRG